MMDEAELATKLAKLSRSAVQYFDSEFSRDQEKALDYYQGNPLPGDDDEYMEARSKVVSRDVAEVVDWSLPELVRMFVGSEEAVEFESRTEEGEEGAKQATQAVRHVVFNDNDGFNIIHDQIKDGLLQKLGVVRVWWGTRGESAKQTIEGLSEEAAMAYFDDEDFQVVAQEEGEDGTITLRLEEKETPQVHIDSIAPEHFLISEQAADEDEAPYIASRTTRTHSELVSEGYDEKLLEGISEGEALDDLDLSRDSEIGSDIGDTSVDKAGKEYTVFDEFARIDVDDDGESEWIRAVRVGKTILHHEEVSAQEFVCFTPKRMPHRVLGNSLADDVMDIQEVKTALLRGALDNTAMVVDPQKYVDMDKITADTLEDLMVWQPGGIIRGRGQNAIDDISMPDITGSALNMIEYADAAGEKRTGVSRYNQGLDADSLNKTATGYKGMMEAGQQRRDLIARLYAQAFCKICQKVFGLLVRHQNAERMMKIHGKWEPVNPRTWKINMKARPMVGLGTGNKDAVRDNMMMVLQNQMALAPYQLANAENMHKAAVKMTAAMGVGNPEEYYQNPQDIPPQEPQPDPEMVKAQADMNRRAQEFQLKQAETAEKLQSQERLAAQRMELDELKAEMKANNDRQMLEFKQDLERERLEMQTRLKTIEMGIQADLKAQEIAMTGDTNTNIPSPVDQ